MTTARTRAWPPAARRATGPCWSRVSARTTWTAWPPRWACRSGRSPGPSRWCGWPSTMAAARDWSACSSPTPRAPCWTGPSSAVSGWACLPAAPPSRRWLARSGARTPPPWPAPRPAIRRRCSWSASFTVARPVAGRPTGYLSTTAASCPSGRPRTATPAARWRPVPMAPPMRWCAVTPRCRSAVLRARTASW
ncbi:hypothetical protein D3C71_1190710 [compost metagenome]